MGTQPGAESAPTAPLNYFNYFTEIEEHFQRARGTSLFLLSPLDWALIESWKNADVPLEAVLRGIDVAFEKWRSRRVKTQMVNSLAFCAQAVLTEAQVMAGRRTRAPPAGHRAAALQRRGAASVSGGQRRADAGRLRRNRAPPSASWPKASSSTYNDLESLEQRLTVLEEKMIAAARTAQTDEQLLATRQELDHQLRPYRGKMTAAQLSMLEKQYLERHLLEKAGLPRLSLFYMR